MNTLTPKSKNKLKGGWLFIIFTLLSLHTSAQKSIDGHWEGQITLGGLNGQRTIPLELYLVMDGATITGRSYLYVDDLNVIVMAIKGRLYGDRSAHIEEFEFFPTDNPELLPPFFRKYQFIYYRSIWDSRLEGFWQEIKSETPLDEKRERGRLILTRTKEPRNKA